MNKMQLYCKIESPLGILFASEADGAITALWIEGQKYAPAAPFEFTESDAFTRLKKYLTDYFNGLNPEIDFPIKLNGSPFREQVWKYLIEIPYGKTATYKDIANRYENDYDKRMSALAVGGAVGHNPLLIIVPCHRVLGTGGGLTGFAAGLDVKEKLLKIEGIIS